MSKYNVLYFSSWVSKLYLTVEVKIIMLTTMSLNVCGAILQTIILYMGKDKRKEDK